MPRLENQSDGVLWGKGKGGARQSTWGGGERGRREEGRVQGVFYKETVSRTNCDE